MRNIKADINQGPLGGLKLVLGYNDDNLETSYERSNENQVKGLTELETSADAQHRLWQHWSIVLFCPPS